MICLPGILVLYGNCSSQNENTTVVNSSNGGCAGAPRGTDGLGPLIDLRNVDWFDRESGILLWDDDFPLPLKNEKQP